MTNLIVDFPHHQRSGTTSTSSSSPSKKKKVQFTKTSSLKFIKRIDTMVSDPNEIWYNSKDYKAFKVQQKKSVQSARHSLDVISASNQDMKTKVRQMDAVDITGIENVVTPAMIQRALKCRNQCINAVLDEQDRQDAKNGRVDADRLAQVSCQYSKYSRKRAQNIGKLHSRR